MICFSIFHLKHFEQRGKTGNMMSFMVKCVIVQFHIVCPGLEMKVKMEIALREIHAERAVGRDMHLCLDDINMREALSMQICQATFVLVANCFFFPKRPTIYIEGPNIKKH